LSQRTSGPTGGDPLAERGYIHAGPNGAGHFVKTVHNGIEYRLMQAYAEGFEILIRSRQEHSFADKILSAMLKGFSVHIEPKVGPV
jgi:6-phosphogluconate dehydrogenase (decarboxylating)